MLLDAVYEEKLEGAEGRDAELRYVTEHFRDLQGLQGAPVLIGGCLAFAFVRNGGRHVSLVLLGGLCLLLITWGWARWLRRWYKAEYGDITKPKLSSEQVPGAGLLTIALLLLYAVLWIAPKHTNTACVFLLYGQGFVLQICTAAAPRHRWILLRRLLYRIELAATTVLVIVVYLFGLYEYPALFALCASPLILVFYDHWLLGYLLKPRIPGVEASYE